MRIPLALALIACVAATLFHHVHNAEFLAEYPNMPVSLSRGSVYAAWLCATGVGILGYGLLVRGYRGAGLGLLVLYACYGLDGLVHYALAPLSAHTTTMHLSIRLEAATSASLLIVVLRQMRKKMGSVPI